MVIVYFELGSAMDGTVSLQNSYVEALSFYVSVFGDRAYKEVIKFK